MNQHTRLTGNGSSPAKVEDYEALCAKAASTGCFDAVLRLITGKWKTDILWALGGGKQRFGELMRAMPGITQHMLTAQLRDLERHGLVTRTAYPEVPPRVEYELTPAATALRPVFQSLVEWAARHSAELNLSCEKPRP